jgi:MEDS: MEthanogen/methylotroph, DcmR Sensory domain
MNNDTGWKLANADLFWGDLAFCDHVLQVYDTDELYVEAFAGFVSSGIQLGDCCVVFLAEAHRKALHSKLTAMGINVEAAIADDSYIPLDAQETLSKFMVNGMPDEELLGKAMNDVFDRGYRAKRVVRAGGEMSALLLAQGNWDAAIGLERATNKVRETNPFSVFCAFSRAAFAIGDELKLHHVCAEHSKIISGRKSQSEVIHYHETEAA